MLGTGNSGQYEYDEYLKLVASRYGSLSTDPIFTTDVQNLFEIYLSGFATDERQYHNCNACRKFMETYGGLVTINAEGQAVPLFWAVGDAPALYHDAIRRVRKAVVQAAVNGVFYSSDKRWGSGATSSEKHGCTFTHYCVMNLNVWKNKIQTPYQAMAEKAEDRKNVLRALAEFPREVVDKAIKILEADVLYRAEKVIGPAKFLQRLHQERDSATDKQTKQNLMWRSIALAPAGFCHPRASMIGTLLEDLASGTDLEDCIMAFGKKMHPLKYQRPTAAPSQQSIDQAEKIVEELGLRKAFARRYARLDEIEAFWTPTAISQAQGGDKLFGSVKAKGQTKLPDASLKLPLQKTTFVKFQAEVLPRAIQIDLYTPYHGSYTGVLTAVHEDAPRLFHWNHPFSWYLWASGSTASQWGLKANSWVQVNAISYKPAFWFGSTYTNESKKRILFMLDGARESKPAQLCLFPEIIRSELHNVRKVIEAYSHQGTPDGAKEGTANGISYGGSSDSWGARVRVTDLDGDTREYLIDRWD